MAQRIRLGELLVKAGVLDELQLRSALNQQRQWGGQLGKLLVELGFVDEAVMVRALSKQLGLPRARLDAAEVPPEILCQLDPGVAKAQRYCPERYDPARKVLRVAMADPTDVTAIDEVAFRTGHRVEATIAGEGEIVRAIDRIFFGRDEPRLELDLGSGAPGARLGLSAFPELDPRQLGADPEPEERFPVSRSPSPRSAAERFGPIDPGPAPERFPRAPAERRAPRASGPPSSPPAAPPVWGSPAPATPPDSRLSYWGEPSSVGADLEDVAARVEAAQKRQNRAIRVMLDLLIERGVFTEDEFRARLGAARQRSRR